MNRKMLIALLASCGISLFAGLRDGLLFYAPFEDGTEPEIAGGAKTSNSGLGEVPGKVGMGVLSEGAGILYNNVGNLNLARGTVAFWVKPEVDFKNLEKPAILFRAVHLAFVYQPHGRAFFMTGNVVPKVGFKWDYSLDFNGLQNWKAGEWHHVVLTWDSGIGVKSLTIDGRLVKTVRTRHFPSSISANAPLEFGVGFKGVVDEIYIYDNMRDVNDLNTLYHSPEKSASEFRRVDSVRRTLPASATAAVKQASLQAPFDDGDARGVVNQGKKGSDRGIPLNVKGRLKPGEGTVLFFVRPDGDVKNQTKSFTLFRAGHLALTYHPRNRKLFFMSGGSENGTFAWDYSCYTELPFQWKAGQWHGVGMSWKTIGDKLEKRIWLDGKQVFSSSTTRKPERIYDREFALMQGFSGTIDELSLWKTALSAEDILFLTAYPELAASAAGRSSAKLMEGSDPLFRRLRREIRGAEQTEPLSFSIKAVAPEKTIVAPGESFPAEIHLENRSLKTFQGEVCFTLRDVYLKSFGEKKRRIHLAPGERKRLSLPFQAPKRGAFRVEAVWNWNGKRILRDVASFAVWNKKQEPDPESFFGNHVNGWSNGAYFAQAHKLGQNWMRNHNMVQTTWWYRMRPDPGVYTYGNDFQLNDLKKYNMFLLGQLFTTPYWAAADRSAKKSTGYNAGWTPRLDLFAGYVKDAVKRYGDRIRYWEVWNEPDVSMFYRGTPEEFAKVVQTAAKAVHEADPRAVVMAAGYTHSGWGWHRRTAKAGAFKGIDMISLHYGTPDAPPEETYVKLKDTVNHFQGLAVKYGDGKPLPVWDTEGGIGSTTYLRGLDFPFLPPESKREPDNSLRTAIRVVQGSAIHMALGIGKHFIYLQSPPGRNGTGVYLNTAMIDFNNVPKPVLMSRVAMQEQVDYTSFRKLVRKEDARFWAFVFRHKTKPETVVLWWTGDGGRVELSPRFPGKVTAGMDLFGNPLEQTGPVFSVTEEPSYLRIASADADGVAAAIERASLKVRKAPAKLESLAGEEKPRIPKLPDFVAPSENPAGVFQLDLRRFCNMGLADDASGNGRGGWSDEGDLNDMRDLKTGRRTFYGVPFEIIDPKTNRNRAVITLSGAAKSALPREIRAIPVNRRARALYFLHAGSWSARGAVLEYVIHFEDGTKEVVEIRSPEHINNWWIGWQEGEVSRPVPVQVKNTISGKPEWRYLRVYEWENRHDQWTRGKGVKIRSIDIRSRNAGMTPIVIAITGV